MARSPAVALRAELAQAGGGGRGGASLSPVMGKPIRASSALAEASALFEEGRFQAAHAGAVRLARGHGAEALGANILAARIELRFGTLNAATSRLEALEGEARKNPTVLTLTGIALFRTGLRDRGLQSIEDAYRQAKLPCERAEAAYYRAWAAYSERDLDAADRWIASALDEAEGAVYARGLALSAWIAAARVDYQGAARSFRLALAALRSSRDRDDDLVGHILHELAVYAAELPDADLAEFVGAKIMQFAWPSESAHDHFQTLLHYGIALQGAGDVERALDALDAAESTAGHDHPTWVAHVELERADLYRVLREPTAARRAMRRAVEMLRRTDWSQAVIDDEMALLESSCAAARVDATTASEWLARYSAIPKKDEGWHTLTSDRRVQANELHARGIVEAALGDRPSGLAKLREALEIWHSLGYNRRAAYALADIADFSEATISPDVNDLLAQASNHPLLLARSARRTQAPALPEARPELPGAERRVLDALCAGASVREIALQSNRSEFTIRNTLKRLFKRFEVRSSAALVAKALQGNAQPPNAKKRRRSVTTR